MITRKLDLLTLPDSLIRVGIRVLVKRRLKALRHGGSVQQEERKEELIKQLSQGPIAVATDEANDQHYEVPAAFYSYVLGPMLKYSCCHWPAGVTTLAEAEVAMMDLVIERAQIKDGQDVLDLGCGWGSFTLHAAQRFPQSRFVAVSNSNSQRVFITEQAARIGLENVSVITADINELKLSETFDRIVSIEMFEHMRKYQALGQLVSSMLKDDGQLFVHVFCHSKHAYLFEDKTDDDWMARYFFTGGTMPSADLLPRCFDTLSCTEQWWHSGDHYAKTAEAWLENMDRHRTELQPHFQETYGDEAKRWWVYWRTFFMACAEHFNYSHGAEWHIEHYTFRKS